MYMKMLLFKEIIMKNDEQFIGSFLFINLF